MKSQKNRIELVTRPGVGGHEKRGLTHHVEAVYEHALTKDQVVDQVWVVFPHSQVKSVGGAFVGGPGFPDLNGSESPYHPISLVVVILRGKGVIVVHNFCTVFISCNRQLAIFGVGLLRFSFNFCWASVNRFKSLFLTLR